MEADGGEESEGSEESFGVGDSDQSTPIIGRNEKEGRYLVRKAVEGSTRARYGKSLPAGSEAEDSSREDIDTQISEVEREKVMIMISEVGDLHKLCRRLCKC
jgi:hypothetical protein